MPGKIKLLRGHVDHVNKILSDNREYFCAGTSIIVVPKQNKIKKELYTIEQNLFLKSEYKDKNPSIIIHEAWINDKIVGYMYRLTMPFVEYCYGCTGLGEKVHFKTFEFRYELHEDIPNHKPKFHLHVLENVPPSYPTHEIEFNDFFDVVKREFLKSGKANFI